MEERPEQTYIIPSKSTHLGECLLRRNDSVYNPRALRRHFCNSEKKTLQTKIEVSVYARCL